MKKWRNEVIPSLSHVYAQDVQVTKLPNHWWVISWANIQIKPNSLLTVWDVLFIRSTSCLKQSQVITGYKMIFILKVNKIIVI